MIPKQKPSAVDYMFHFWGHAFLVALDGESIGERQLKRWRKLLGHSVMADMYMSAIREARDFKRLPVPADG